MIDATIALRAPVIEIISLVTNALNVGIQLVDPVEEAFLARVNRVRVAAASDFPLAFANRHKRGVARFVHVDAVPAGAENGEGQIRGVYFESVVVVEPAHANVQRAFGQTDLGHIVGQVQKRKAGMIGQPDHRVAQMQFRAGTFIRPKFVAGGYGAVDDRRNPIIRACRIERNVAVGVGQSSHAAWRIIFIGCGALWDQHRR